MLDTVQLAADRAHEEVASLRQTYNLYKAKVKNAPSEIIFCDAFLKFKPTYCV